MLIVWVTFIGIAAAILAAYWLFIVVPEGRDQATLKRRLRGIEKIAPKSGSGSLLKAPDKLSTIPTLNRLLSRSDVLTPRVRTVIERSGLALTPGLFLLLSVTAAGAGDLALLLYTRIWWLGLAGAVVSGLIPLMVVNVAATRRLNKFSAQFPEAIDLIARAMRAGHAFSTGLKIAADELPAPIGVEFKKLYERHNYGAQLPEALRAFADGVPSLDARFFVTAVLTQRETGGNLSEVLDRLASVMRERFRIKRDVRVKSAHGRMTAYILAGMPPVVGLLMMMSSPDQFKTLLTDPMGHQLLMGAAGLQAIGALVVRKLVNIEY